MGIKTALYQEHIALKGQMVEFAGVDLPLHYGSQLNEHLAVRESAGIFDVSHMNIVDIRGTGAKRFLSYILANNIGKIKPYQALYSCLLNPAGGVIDDLIVYMFSDEFFRLILNAATREKDLKWLNQQAKGESDVEIFPQQNFSIIALQGPKAFEVLSRTKLIESVELKPFWFGIYHSEELGDLMVARTGYTGEDGCEMVIQNQTAAKLWQKLLENGAVPAGLGARDTLRLEAGFHLYGQDMDENTSPLESNLTWTIGFEPKDRDFIGRAALEKSLLQPPQKEFVGLMLEKGGILRQGQKIYSGNKEIGVMTSGGFSPTLGCSIGLARVLKNVSLPCFVSIREKFLPVRITPPVFVKNKR